MYLNIYMSILSMSRYRSFMILCCNCKYIKRHKGSTPRCHSDFQLLARSAAVGKSRKCCRKDAFAAPCLRSESLRPCCNRISWAVVTGHQILVHGITAVPARVQCIRIRVARIRLHHFRDNVFHEVISPRASRHRTDQLHASG